MSYAEACSRSTSQEMFRPARRLPLWAWAQICPGHRRTPPRQQFCRPRAHPVAKSFRSVPVAL